MLFVPAALMGAFIVATAWKKARVLAAVAALLLLLFRPYSTVLSAAALAGLAFHYS